jgi:hypothetical protein
MGSESELEMRNACGIVAVVGGHSALRQIEKLEKMKTYTFNLGALEFKVASANYGEALAALIFHLGNEQIAAQWVFISAE